jgi:hypothetical protein
MGRAAVTTQRSGNVRVDVWDFPKLPQQPVADRLKRIDLILPCWRSKLFYIENPIRYSGFFYRVVLGQEQTDLG